MVVGVMTLLFPSSEAKKSVPSAKMYLSTCLRNVKMPELILNFIRRPYVKYYNYIMYSNNCMINYVYICLTTNNALQSIWNIAMFFLQ
jgi:hypothetical protein